MRVIANVVKRKALDSILKICETLNSKLNSNSSITIVENFSSNTVNIFFVANHKKKYVCIHIVTHAGTIIRKYLFFANGLITDTDMIGDMKKQIQDLKQLNQKSSQHLEQQIVKLKQSQQQEIQHLQNSRKSQQQEIQNLQDSKQSQQKKMDKLEQKQQKQEHHLKDLKKIDMIQKIGNLVHENIALRAINESKHCDFPQYRLSKPIYKKQNGKLVIKPKFYLPKDRQYKQYLNQTLKASHLSWKHLSLVVKILFCTCISKFVDYACVVSNTPIVSIVCNCVQFEMIRMKCII